MLVELRRVEVEGREVVLLGTTMVTAEALDEIEAELRSAAPDAVVLDYDATRWRWVEVLRGDSEIDLVQVIKSGQMAELNGRLAMGVLAKFVAPRSGVPEDAEFVRCHEVAADLGAPIVFGRRAVDVEGLRAWRGCTVGGRAGFAWNLLRGSLKRTQLGESAVAQMEFDGAQALRDAMDCAAQAAPVVFDEADRWLAGKVVETPGRVVVVTRAATLDVLEAALVRGADVAGLDVVPEKSLFSRLIPWIFTALIIAAFILGFVFADPDKMEQAAVAWFASNMIFAAVGALLALAHPVTIIATSLSAPFVSLNPAVGAGMVGALVQAFVAPPTVRDMDRVGDDITRISGWWRNRLARLVLIFVFANVFSSIGSFAAFAWFPTN